MLPYNPFETSAAITCAPQGAAGCGNCGDAPSSSPCVAATSGSCDNTFSAAVSSSVVWRLMLGLLARRPVLKARALTALGFRAVRAVSSSRCGGSPMPNTTMQMPALTSRASSSGIGTPVHLAMNAAAPAKVGDVVYDGGQQRAVERRAALKRRTHLVHDHEAERVRRALRLDKRAQLVVKALHHAQLLGVERMRALCACAPCLLLLLPRLLHLGIRVLRSLTQAHVSHQQPRQVGAHLGIAASLEAPCTTLVQRLRERLPCALPHLHKLVVPTVHRVILTSTLRYGRLHEPPKHRGRPAPPIGHLAWAASARHHIVAKDVLARNACACRAQGHALHAARHMVGLPFAVAAATSLRHERLAAVVVDAHAAGVRGHSRHLPPRHGRLPVSALCVARLGRRAIRICIRPDAHLGLHQPCRGIAQWSFWELDLHKVRGAEAHLSLFAYQPHLFLLRWRQV
eukprot:359660-Chlamydomonas_euryale.AAC.19